jgi:hypothetical protein
MIDSRVADVVAEQSEELVDADPVDGFRFRTIAGSATATTTVESIPARHDPKIIASDLPPALRGDITERFARPEPSTELMSPG